MNLLTEQSLKKERQKQEELNFFLMEAVNKKNLSKIKELLNQGADIHYKNDYALCHLTALNQLKSIQYIIGQGANLFVNDNSPLKIAVINGFIDIIEYFLSLGAKESIVKEFSSYHPTTEAWYLAKRLDKELPIQNKSSFKHKL